MEYVDNKWETGNGSELADEIKIRPVSYTHLDVYKRQVSQGSNMVRSNRALCLNENRRLFKIDVYLLINTKTRIR